MEAVAYAADGEEVAGGGGVVFEVTAEADDEVVDGAGVGVFMHASDFFVRVLAGLGRPVRERRRSASMRMRWLGTESSRVWKWI